MSNRLPDDFIIGTVEGHTFHVTRRYSGQRHGKTAGWRAEQRVGVMVLRRYSTESRKVAVQWAERLMGEQEERLRQRTEEKP